MASKVAYLREFDVDPTGNIVERNASTTTIKMMKNVHKEWRVVVDADNASTAGNPTIEDYIALEEVAGRKFQGMIGMLAIVTQS
jgi:hypothetical protein